MAILIKGQEMPKNCCGCVFSSYTPTGKIPYCKRTGKNLTADVYFNKRDSSCPLVPVPPHGRLIDVDYADKYAHDELEVANSYLTGWEAARAMQKIYQNAPTVIPAEEGE